MDARAHRDNARSHRDNARAHRDSFFGVAGDARHLFDPTCPQLVCEVGNGVSKLREDQNLLAWMLFRQEFVEFDQLMILVGLPLACEFEDGE